MKLGITYLWIDSLCIIQDSTNDCQDQLGKMGSIFEGAYITIAANSSDDSEAGLALLSNVGYTSSEISGTSTDGSYHLGVRNHISHWYPDNDDFRYWTSCSNMSKEYPLLTRAWVFQERLLSPRVLHFTSAELVWECNETVFCECSGIQFDHERVHMKIDYKKNLEGLSNYESCVAYFDEWRHMVSEYTRNEMTLERDVFPALSGVARQISGVLKTEYAAGLWQDDLIRDLLWETYDIYATRPETWRAPTWSWASIIGKVNYKFWKDINVHCTSLSASVTPVSANDFGEIESAQLTVEGEIISATLEYSPKLLSQLRSAFQESSQQSRSERDLPKLTGFVFRCDTHPTHSWYFYTDYDLSKEGKGHMNSGDTVFCIRMATLGFQEVFLVLRQSPFKNGAYERIGIGRYAFEGHTIHLGETWSNDDYNFPFETSDYRNGVQIVNIEVSPEQSSSRPVDQAVLFDGAERQVITII
jgi:hypothetical protein